MTTVAVLGAGKIGQTVLTGLLKSGWDPAELIATVRRPERAAELRAALDIRMLDTAEAVRSAEIVLVAVKPQDAGALMSELEATLPADRLLVSLCAGLPTEFFNRRLDAANPVVRAMTNTPALVDQAVTALSAGEHAADEHLAAAERLFKPLGITLRMPEAHQDAVTALSGCCATPSTLDT